MLARLLDKVEEIVREAERQNSPPVALPRRPTAPVRHPAPIDWEGRDAEPIAGKVVAVPPSAPASAAVPPLDLREILHSRTALRQAFFLREILGPPRALQGPHEDGR